MTVVEQALATMDKAAREIDRLRKIEKRCFKFETALMLISEGFLNPVELAKSALSKEPETED